MPTAEEIAEIYASTKTIAVVGASRDPFKASNSVPLYLQEQGFRVIPVSPKAGELFGEPIATSLSDITEPVDVVDVFRPPDEAADIAREAGAIGAKVLWFQPGNASDEAIEVARAEGLHVVFEMCMRTTHLQLRDMGLV